jgi:hypothetical protein
MSNIIIRLGKVIRVESTSDADYSSGLRIKATLIAQNKVDETKSELPWYFPLMPKTFQTVPKKDECVLLLFDEAGSTNGQGYYIGPIISQPQFFEKCEYDTATSLLKDSNTRPVPNIESLSGTSGSFAEQNDVAVEGRGTEDIILRYGSDKSSEIDIRAGIRCPVIGDSISGMTGNIMFNTEDPAYIQLKRKNSIATKKNNRANSVVNVVADRINIMSNKDENVSSNIHNRKTLVEEEKMDEIMDNLHQVPMGDKLVELLKIMKGAIMHHVHPWAGMEQCGDWPGYIKKLDGYDIDSILSDYVRIS